VNPRTGSTAAWLVAAALLAAGCSGGGQLRDERDAVEGPDAGTPDAGPYADAGRPALTPVAKPTFDPDAPAPCDSHTACYLAAEKAHDSGARAGYLLALERCEYYRGSYQLEEFYGLCLLILADAYRHLDNFDEAVACYRRFLDTNPDAGDLAIQARSALDEVEQGKQVPYAYHDYLEALSLLTLYANSQDRGQLERAHALLEALAAEQPDWFLASKVTYLLDQIAGVLGQAPSAEPPPADSD